MCGRRRVGQVEMRRKKEYSAVERGAASEADISAFLLEAALREKEQHLKRLKLILLLVLLGGGLLFAWDYHYREIFFRPVLVEELSYEPSVRRDPLDLHFVRFRNASPHYLKLSFSWEGVEKNGAVIEGAEASCELFPGESFVHKTDWAQASDISHLNYHLSKIEKTEPSFVNPLEDVTGVREEHELTLTYTNNFPEAVREVNFLLLYCEDEACRIVKDYRILTFGREEELLVPGDYTSCLIEVEKETPLELYRDSYLPAEGPVVPAVTTQP